MASSSTTNTLPHRHEARPCRVGGGVAPSRHAVRAAFNFPTTMANTGCMKRQCVYESRNGSQVRRGSLIGSPSALLSAARETRLARLSSAQQSGNLANGGAQTAPGCAAADSLPSQAAPASSIFQPIPRRAAGRKSEAWRRPGHRTSSAAVADGENVRRAVRAVVGRAHLATSAAACSSPENAARGRRGATRPRPGTRPADARLRCLQALKAQNYAPPDALRSSTPRPHGGGHCGREDNRKSLTRSPGALPQRAIFRNTNTHTPEQRTTR